MFVETYYFRNLSVSLNLQMSNYNIRSPQECRQAHIKQEQEEFEKAIKQEKEQFEKAINHYIDTIQQVTKKYNGNNCPLIAECGTIMHNKNKNKEIEDVLINLFSQAGWQLSITFYVRKADFHYRIIQCYYEQTCMKIMIFPKAP